MCALASSLARQAWCSTQATGFLAPNRAEILKSRQTHDDRKRDVNPQSQLGLEIGLSKTNWFWLLDFDMQLNSGLHGQLFHG